MISIYQIKIMKKTLKNLGRFLVLLVLVSSCQEDENTFGDLNAPSNFTLEYEVVGADAEHPNGDGSGKVNLVAHADGAISYKFLFSDQDSENSPGGVYTKQFSRTGVNTYTITAIAYGRGGVASNITQEVTVLSNFSDPETLALLTGSGSKVWYWAAAMPGHLGVGPNDSNTATNHLPTYYAAAPFEKAGSPDSSCLYENVLTFRNDAGVLKFTLDNGGSTFYNNEFTTASQDMCEPLDTSGEKVVTLSPSNSLVAPEFTTGTTMNFTNNGFMGYFIGTSTYEILEITPTKMVVRAVMGGNDALAWYHTFTTTPPTQEEQPDFTRLVFSDDFDTPGEPDASKWNFEIGNNNGWGNNEKQYYRRENAVVEGGNLKITAKKETFQGFQYTSARLNSHNHEDFTYGKVEFRAKLPAGGGTWPALWMLGSNYETVDWPACGEIDIMEHIGNRPNFVSGTLHYPGRSGGNADTGSTTAFTDVTTAFHVYSVVWTEDVINFYVDDTLYKSVVNTPEMPFHWDFFLIMNVAMGGNLGGDIDPAFTQATLEVDYVKVYQ
jgi:beta-glucanase (GH16 family)